LEATVEVG